MKRSTSGLLIGAGAALVWFLRGRLFGSTYRVSIELMMKNGRCGIREEPHTVKLHKLFDDKIRWDISNPSATGCAGQRTICIGNWRLNGIPTRVPPVRNAHGLCRPVQPGHSVPLVAVIDYQAPLGEYEYDILIDDVVAVDPIVKLVL